MAIDAIGNTLYVHQNMHIPATKQSEQQTRFDLQNAAAAEALKQKEEQIEETRPTEESYRIDPEHEHNKERSDEEAGEKKEEIKRKKVPKEAKEGGDEPPHLLDIKV